MDRYRINQIDGILFRKMLKEKKITLDASYIETGLKTGAALGIDQTIMRAYLAELIVNLANAAFDGAHLFQLTSNVTKVSDEMRMEIESKMFSEYFRTRRLRLDKHMFEGYVAECEKAGIDHNEAVDYVIGRLKGLLADVIS